MKTLAAAVLVCLTRLASAGDRTITLDRTCVEIDGAVDSLAPVDREYAEKLLRQVLERENLLVVAGDCTESYRLSHEHVEDRYVIRLQSSAGKRRMTTTSLDELYVKYRKMARSLLEAKTDTRAPAAAAEPPVASAPTVAAVDPIEPLAAEQTAPDQPASEPAPSKRRLWYGLIGAQLTGGAAVSVGYRRKVAEVASIDVAATSMMGSELSGGSLGVKLLADATSLSATTTVYAGGGFGFGGLERGDDAPYGFSGGGMHAELTAGMRIAMNPTVHALVQFNLMLPFYQLTNFEHDTDYAPMAALSGGIGW